MNIVCYHEFIVKKTDNADDEDSDDGSDDDDDNDAIC